MKRKSLEGNACPVARSLDVIGDCWSLLIVRSAITGTRRFTQFQTELGIAKNILTIRLKALVAHNILVPAAASDGSAYKEYVLTRKGKDLFPVLVALRQWGEVHLFEGSAPGLRLVEKKTGHLVPLTRIRSSEGRALRPEDTQLMKIK